MQTRPVLSTPKRRLGSTRCWRLALCLVAFLSSSTTWAAVYEVGVDGSLAQILGPGSPVLADDDVVRVPAGVYPLLAWASPTLTADISLLGEGPGATVIQAPTGFTNPFLSVDASLRISGLSLVNFGDALVLSPTAGTSLIFEARRLEIDGGSRLGDGSGNRGIVAFNSSTGDLDRVSIKDCHFHHLDDAGIYLLTSNIVSAEIAGNLVEEVGLAGISVGNDGPAANRDAYSKNFIISGNHVIGVHAVFTAQDYRTFGIAAFGREATIHGDVLNDLDLSVPVGDTNGRLSVPTAAGEWLVTDNIVK